MNYIAVKGFSDHQHYRDRNPVWIKLYNRVMDDEAFIALSDAARGHLMLIWLLASRRRNKLPADAKAIGRAIQASGRVNLGALVSAGFLIPWSESLAPEPEETEQVASAPLAEPEQNACLEREREKEAERKPEAVVVEEEPTGPLADHSYAIRITVTANQAITEKWGERPTPLLHGTASQMAAELRAAGVPLDVARRSIIDQIARKKDEPPRSIHWFRPGIEQAWQQEQQRRLDATTTLPAPAALSAPVSPFQTPAILAWAAKKDAEDAAQRATEKAHA